MKRDAPNRREAKASRKRQYRKAQWYFLQNQKRLSNHQLVIFIHSRGVILK